VTDRDHAVLFLCDADHGTGFGHASRCLGLFERLARTCRGLDAGSVAFQGRFDRGARERVRAAAPQLVVYDSADRPRARVAVIDRMADTEDPEAWDRALLDEVMRRCDRAVHLTSGRTAPELPDGVYCIGHHPDGPAPRPPLLRWGLDLAPVATHLAGDVTRDPESTFVALGGHPDGEPLGAVLRALRGVRGAVPVDVLLSPVAPPIDVRELGAAVRVHRDVGSVAPFLARAGLVVASYGHLAWEALAAGAALCIVGQKQFQVTLAEALDRNGLAVSAGLASRGREASLAAGFARTIARREELQQRAAAAVDGRGLDRIAEILCGLCRH
jgi:hypothetical protein